MRMMAATATPISNDRDLTREAPAGRAVGRWSARGWTRVDWCAAALIAGQLSLLAVISFRGSFYGDDLPRMSQAARTSLSWDYLTDEVFGHLAPGYRFVYWAQAHVAPLHHGAAALASLAAQAVVSALFWLVLRRLFGPRPAILMVLTVFAFSAGQLPSFLWWSAAVNLLPAQLALLVAILAHLEVVSGRRQTRFVVIAALVFGMLFWEKVALLAVELPLLTLALADGTWRQRLHVVRGLWRIWLAYAYPIVFFLLLFMIGGYGSPRQPVSTPELAEFLGVTLSQGLAPAVLGGPLAWTRVGPYFGVAAPTIALSLACSLVLVAYCSVCLRRAPRRTVAGLLLVLVPVVLSASVTALTRFSYFGFNVARDYRYLADLFVPVLLGLTLAGLRPRVLLHTISGSVATTPSIPTHQPATTSRRRLAPSISVGAAVAVFATTMSVSAYRYAVVWQENPVGHYIAAARQSLTARPGEAPPALYDVPVPAYVLDPVYAPENHLSRVLAPLRHQPSYDTPSQLMGVLDTTGHATGVKLETAAVSAPGPAGECHWFAADGDVTVDLVTVAPKSDYVLTVYYLAKSATPVAVDTRRRRSRATTFSSHGPLHLQKGLGTLIVQAPNRTIDAVDVRELTADVCVLRVDVQRALPARPPGTLP